VKRVSDKILLRLAPLVFVLLWSTGWVVAKYAAPHADPFTFLAIRFALAAVLMGLVAWAMSAPWRMGPRAIGHGLLSGVFLHGIYLGAVWWAIAQGLPAGISALIAALQPLLTALMAPRLLGERLVARQWIGIGAGFVGLVIAIWPKLAAVDLARLDGLALPIFINMLGMVSVTVATFHQKRFLAGGDLRVISMVQYVGAALVVLPVALLFEPMRFDMTVPALVAMAWSVIALSLGAIGLLLWLIRHGAVSRAATFIYLVPPVAAIEAWLVFGETLTPMQWAGMGLTVLGVALATRSNA
jgi:drug/metabolite transporter (DMT)-like permease